MNSAAFTIGGNKYNVVGGVMKSEYLTKNRVLRAGFDIGLFKLDDSNEVKGVSPAPLNTARQENLKVGTYVGFGMTGTGETGAILKTQGDEKLAATNLIELVRHFNGAETIITSDFDNPELAFNQFNYDERQFPTNLEGNIVGGDSGGGVFANTKSGVPVLVGVNSFTIGGDKKTGEGAGKYNKNLVFGEPATRETMGAVRVRSFVGWIDEVIKNFQLSGPLKKLPSGFPIIR